MRHLSILMIPHKNGQNVYIFFIVTFGCHTSECIYKFLPFTFQITFPLCVLLYREKKARLVHQGRGVMLEGG